nr:MAG TPA: hypothetical protein [Caudoviricetes sp.]
MFFGYLILIATLEPLVFPSRVVSVPFAFLFTTNPI